MGEWNDLNMWLWIDFFTFFETNDDNGGDCSDDNDRHNDKNNVERRR